MTLRLSTGLRDQLLEEAAKVNAVFVGTDITFVDGGGSNDSMTRTGGSFITDGFEIGDWVCVFNATTPANDIQAKILSVVALTIEIGTGLIDTGEAGAADTVIAVAKGGSIQDLMKHGIIDIFSGVQPADADLTESGFSKLVSITLDGNAHDEATGDNGLEFQDAAVDGILSKVDADVWKGDPDLAGTAGWFRFYGQAKTTGDSTTGVRFDGAINTSGAELNVASVDIALGTDFIINQFDIIMPTA
jgi:hypothetical protein